MEQKLKIFVLRYSTFDKRLWANVIGCEAEDIDEAIKKLGLQLHAMGQEYKAAVVLMPEKPPKWFKHNKNDTPEHYLYRWQRLCNAQRPGNPKNDIHWIIEELPRY